MPEATHLSLDPLPSAKGDEAREVVQHLSHELRQPLSAIESITYYLRMVVPRHDKRAQEQLEKLHQLVDQMDWILADASQYLQGAPPRTEIVDIYELVYDVAREQIETGVRVELGVGQALTNLDPIQGRHLFRSLLNLARQLARGGEIGVRAWAEGGKVWVRVSVEGARLNTAEMEALFEPFEVQSQPGLGLALACGRHIAEAHGGSLHLESTLRDTLHLRVGFPAAEQERSI